jgi:hypothetical protein
MVDDGKALRRPQPHGAAEPEGRSDGDVFSAFPMNKPRATVVVKKRRGAADTQGDHGAAQGGRAPHGGPRHEERRPRVYLVHPSTTIAGSALSTPATAQGGVRAGDPDARGTNLANAPGDPNDTNDTNTASTPAATAPTRRWRARRDPTRAPGQVTRIVFEPPPPMPSAPPTEAGPRTFEFIEHAEVGYEQVMAGLQQLRAEIDLALRARKFRIR